MIKKSTFFLNKKKKLPVAYFAGLFTVRAKINSTKTEADSSDSSYTFFLSLSTNKIRSLRSWSFHGLVVKAQCSSSRKKKKHSENDQIIIFFVIFTRSWRQKRNYSQIFSTKFSPKFEKKNIIPQPKRPRYRVARWLVLNFGTDTSRMVVQRVYKNQIKFEKVPVFTSFSLIFFTYTRLRTVLSNGTLDTKYSRIVKLKKKNLKSPKKPKKSKKTQKV